MVEKKEDNKQTSNTWLLYAVLSVVFASLTTILGKIGITNIESNLGTAIRTSVVLIMSWIVVFVTHKLHQRQATVKYMGMLTCTKVHKFAQFF